MAFISTWNTTNTSSGSSNSNQIKLPLVSNGVYNFNVDWGDGNNDTITSWNQSEVTHTYSSSGNKTITINGTIKGWIFNNSGDKQKILTISDWGTLELSTILTYGHLQSVPCFYGCSNLTSLANNLINVGLNSYDKMWSGCNSLTSFPLLDTSGVVYFNNAWENCSLLTSFPLINTSSATKMSLTWINCYELTSFPQIDTSNVTSFDYCWSSCRNLTSFPLIDTSAGTTFVQTWIGCQELESFPLIDLSSAVSLFNCWLQCYKLKEFPIGFGLTFGSVLSAQNVFSNTSLTRPVYSRLLQEIESVNSNNNVTFGAIGRRYQKSAVAARSRLVNDHNWIITDGGLSSGETVVSNWL
jgi:hypothetical protein